MFNTFIRIFLLGMLTSLFLVGCSQSDGSSSSSSDPITGEVIGLVINGPKQVAPESSVQLTAVGIIKDDTGITTESINNKVAWASSDENIVVIDNTGTLAGIAEGNATILATLIDDNSTIAIYRVEVLPNPIVSLQIERGYNPNGGEILTDLNVTITTEEYITAWGITADGDRVYVNTDTFWWSDDQQIASINSIVSSYVYGRDLGDTVITAYFKGLSSSINVKVIPEAGLTLTSIEIRKDFENNDSTGGTVTIPAAEEKWVEAWGHYSDGSVKNINRYVSWSSSDYTTAFIFDVVDSYVKGIKGGQATITAEWQGVSSSITAEIIGLNSIEIQKGYVEDGSGEVINTTDNPLNMQTGLANTQYVTAWGNYADGMKRYINTKVFWRSADESIAKFPPLQSSSNLRGINAGTTEISASWFGIVGTATVNVTAP